MKITEIRIYPFEAEAFQSGIKAYVDITFDGQILIKGFKIIESKTGGRFVGFPSQKGSDGKYYDTVVPVDKSIVKQIRDEVIAKYKAFISEGKPVKEDDSTVPF